MSLIGKKVKSLKGQTKNMIGTITDDYGEYVYVNFPDRAQKGKNTEVSAKLSDLEIIKEIKMKRSTELKLRKLIERIIREETNKKSLQEKISKKDMKLMLDSGNTFRDGKVTAVKDKGRYWITLDTPQYKGSRIYNNDNFEEFYKQITTYIRQYNQ